MATTTKWTPFGVALDITAIGGTVTRTSATEFTVKITASWETYYEGAKTNYGMSATSGGVTYVISKFDGTKRSSGSGSFTGKYSISGNGSAAKTITVTFKNFNSDNDDSATKNVSFGVTVPAWTSYKITYNANGGSGAPGSQTAWKDQTLTLSSTKPTRTGYTFQGWATSDSATSVKYSAGGKYEFTADTTLYAVWKVNTYTVKYNANGGTEAPSNQTKTYGKTLTLSSKIPTRTDYTFKGWATSASATTATYSAGGSYTANAAATLYAVWQLGYTRPRITNLTAARHLESRVEDEQGTYALVEFDWATDKEVSSITISWTSETGGSGTYSVPGLEGMSGRIELLIGDGTISVDSNYTIIVRVTDVNMESTYNYTEEFISLPGTKYAIDFLVGGRGAAFGKPAELEDTLDIGFKTKASKGFVNIPLNENTNFDDVVAPNTYVSLEDVADTYENSPVEAGGTFTLNVESGGTQGQVKQTVTYTSKDDFKVWQRFYYGSEWGEWHQIYAFKGRLLSSINGYYMTAGHTVELNSPIHEQPNGVVLVFSAYDGSPQNSAFNSFFVSKRIVNAYDGAGHDFFMTLSDFSAACCKRLNIYDTRITGDDNNNKTGTGSNGITYANNKYVLRYVFGV